MTKRSEAPGSVPILAAARRRFLQWGFSGTSTAALAQDLGLTKAALYYHYADKEALFLAVVQDYLGELSTDLAGLPRLFDADDGPTALEALAEVFLSRNETSAQMQHLAFQESRHLTPAGQTALSTAYHEAMVRPLSALLTQAVAHGWIRNSKPGEPAVIWIFLGLLTAFLPPGHASSPHVSPSASAFIHLFTSTLKGEIAC